VEYLEMDKELIGKGTRNQQRYRCSIGPPHSQEPQHDKPHMQHTYSISTALNPRSGDLPKVGDDYSLENQTTIIKPENILQLSAMATLTLASPVLVQLFTNSYNEDPFPNKILKLIRDGAKYCREISLAEYDKHNNLLHYCQRIWVPNYELLKLHLLQQHYDILAAGHPGRSKTLKYLCWNYT
jgi:hypothetical protein